MVTAYKRCLNPVLSILICHLPEREVSYLALLDQLGIQTSGNVEVLVDDTPRGVLTIGEKRNNLLASSTGRYVAYIDDDDLIAGNYVRLILNAAREDNDCIGMTGILRRKDKPDWQFRHSITVGRWCKDRNRHIYFRTPNHLNPIKADIAKSVGFVPISHGEDRDYSDRIRPLLKTETFIEQAIYIYQK